MEEHCDVMGLRGHSCTGGGGAARGREEQRHVRFLRREVGLIGKVEEKLERGETYEEA